MLWNHLNNDKFELMPALSDLQADEVEEKLNLSAYFQLLRLKMPESLNERLKYLEEDRLVILQDNNRYSITNVGALLFANSLNDFSSVWRKELRVIQYVGCSRLEIARTRSFDKGYAVCIYELLSYIDALLPSSEPILDSGKRQVVRSFPPVAVRELLLNAIIHQDLTTTGNSILFEVFDDRLEITNPGTLLVEKNRIIDFPAKSRNEILAKMMRRMKLCEKEQLPSPEIVQYAAESTKVILYSRINFFDLTKEQKLWTSYLHSCLLYTKNMTTTNASLRERFGLEKKSASSVTRLLNEAVELKLLKVKKEGTGTKSKRYIPYWA